jgi:hypothetical protein
MGVAVNLRDVLSIPCGVVRWAYSSLRDWLAGYGPLT